MSKAEGMMVLEARGVHKAYRGRTVVDNVDLEFRQGEITGLLGPNGAGKTTTFYIIVGFIQADHGSVFLGGDEITRLPMYKRARRGIGYLPQESSIFRRLSVEENVMAILETLPLNRDQRRERLDELLDEMRISHIRKSKGYQLSGGERRRVEIARAWSPSPASCCWTNPSRGSIPLRWRTFRRASPGSGSGGWAS